MKIGWIGTGIMGLSMCSHLMDGGHEAWVYNRTQEKLRPLVEKGAHAVSSPMEVARN
ncbi:MAG: NAD(P)-binding domain-containing protein, partial [Spirochaetales bacterium]|nr:NAD(P)-binding domain-containing protein [Spirochaetales bacterium]